jgi:hypothetical protein
MAFFFALTAQALQPAIVVSDWLRLRGLAWWLTDQQAALQRRAQR